MFIASFSVACVYFPRLTAGARESSTVLKTGEGGHPCFVSRVRGKVFSLSLLSMLVVSFNCKVFFNEFSIKLR